MFAFSLSILTISTLYLKKKNCNVTLPLGWLFKNLLNDDVAVFIKKNLSKFPKSAKVRSVKIRPTKVRFVEMRSAKVKSTKEESPIFQRASLQCANSETSKPPRRNLQIHWWVGLQSTKEESPNASEGWSPICQGGISKTSKELVSNPPSRRLPIHQGGISKSSKSPIH